ncbi:CHAT domain-containing tetratricopeptide repeat protein [Granulicella aggregans]|uniref:CHAT domain-containing tetratricopeptide repeat protein n=1 Tax=Granulicella aggregans TaxID=474949 RepID=UPI001C85A95F
MNVKPLSGWKLICLVFLALTGAICLPLPARTQASLTAATPASLQFQPGEIRVLQITGEPHSIQVVKIELGGGLVSLRSPETPNRVLDLGRGGRLFYAVEMPETGRSNIEFSSSEHQRPSDVRIELVTPQFTPDQRVHLQAAGIAFARAEMARRHQPGAPGLTDALALYELASGEAAVVGDSSLSRWALTQEARFLLFTKSSFVQTRELLLRAVVLQVKDDAATEALLYKTLSTCDYYLGRLPESISEGERALALYRETGDQYWQGIVLGNLITGYAELGRSEDAASAAREALTDAEQTQDAAGVVFDLTEMADLSRQQGDLQTAFQSFREAERWVEDIRYAPLVQSEIEEAMGRFYVDLGLWAEAEQQLQLCLSHTTADSALALEARGLLARTVARRGKLTAALQQYDEAIATSRKLKLLPEETSLLLDRSATLLQAGRAPAALADARTAGKLSDQHTPLSLRIQSQLAEASACLSACTDPSQSAEIYHRALKLIEESGDREEESIAYFGLAKVYAAQANYSAALDATEKALTLLEHSRSSLFSRRLAANYFAEHRDWYALGVDVAIRLDRLHPGQGYGDKAFQFSERARARAMLDALGDVELNSSDTLATPPALLLRIAANENRIANEKARLLSDASSSKSASTLQALYSEQDALEAERPAANGSLSARNSDRPASISRIQSEFLEPDAALVAISPGEHATYRWLITRTSAKIEALPSMEVLLRHLSSLQQALRQGAPGLRSGEDAVSYAGRVAVSNKQLDASLQRAGSLLLPALPPTIHRIYIVADGPLQALPWNALRTRCGGSTCYLIERYTLSVEPSVSVALALAARPQPERQQRAVVLSDIVPASGNSLPRWSTINLLPGSQREAHAIAKLLPTNQVTSLRGPNATSENLYRSLSPNVSLLHIAAHTLFVAGHPELSGIALSADHDQRHNAQGVLWLHDIPRLNAPPLVVLSGCATQGSDISGEELNSLAQAFFFAGAQQVIASNWKVDDDATADLMRDFYRNLVVRKMPAEKALRFAQLNQLRQHAEVVDWAGFVINGVSARTSFEIVRR